MSLHVLDKYRAYLCVQIIYTFVHKFRWSWYLTWAQFPNMAKLNRLTSVLEELQAPETLYYLSESYHLSPYN